MDVNALLASCQQEMALLDTLQLTLEDEQRAILRLDAAQLDACTERKQQQLAALGQSRAARLTLQQQAGLADAAAWLQWLQQAPAAMQQAWQALELALSRLKALNEVNADMARERQQFATEALDSLRAASQSFEGYGRHGNLAASPAGSRRLGSA